MRRRDLALGLLTLPALARRTAAAETSRVRLARGDDLADLPLMVMQQQQLVERHAGRLGLPSLQSVWPAIGDRGARIGALFGGQADFAVLGAPDVVALWDRSRGTPGAVRALSSLALQPSLLVTRDARVKTIGDFTDRDVIGVPVVKRSVPAVCLEMAAADRWGLQAYARLDPLTQTIADARAARSVVAGTPPVNSHFSTSPWFYDELASPAVHLVLKSNDILGGPHVDRMLVAAPYFATANPTVVQAVLAAQQDACAFIRAHPQDAAEVFLTLTRSARTPDDMAGLVSDPDIVWTTVPQRLMAFAGFLHRIGRVSGLPESWTALMLAEGQSGAGS